MSVEHRDAVLLRVLTPERVNAPVPTLTSDNVPAVFVITPLNVLVASSSPTVSVGVPLTPFTTPDPDRPLMVSLKPFRWKKPFETIRLPLPAPLGI